MIRLTPTALRLFGAAALLASTGACTRAPALDLHQVHAPAGADLSGARAVRVSVTAASAEPGSQLELRRPDGALVFRGAITSGRAVDAHVMLPSRFSSLTAKLRTPRAEQSQQLAVSANSAAGSFP